MRQLASRRCNWGQLDLPAQSIHGLLRNQSIIDHACEQLHLTYDAFPAAIEMRRGITGVRTWEGEPGESQLGFTGEPGGLWRSLGRAPQRL